MGKVSVIIPSYNCSTYITDAIESALSQTYDDLEVIISDDASTDNTCEVVNEIRDPRVRLIVRTENGGAAAARNSAIRAATGRYIAFLNADDYWKPDKLDVQIGKMQELAKCFSYTSFIAQSEKGEELIDVPEQVDYKRLLRRNVIGTSTVVYDAGILGKIYMPLLRRAQDFATWLNILRKCDSALGIREPMTYYVRRNNSHPPRYITVKWFVHRVYRETQGLSPLMSLYYLSPHLSRALWNKIKRLWDGSLHT